MHFLLLMSARLSAFMKRVHLHSFQITQQEPGWPGSTRVPSSVVVLSFDNTTILHRPKYWDVPLNYWVQVFQSDPLPQMFKIKHLAMQSAITNIFWGKKQGHSEELSEFKHGTVIGLIPHWTVSGIIGKWKQPSHEVEDHIKSQSRVLRCMMSKCCQCSADPIKFQTSTDINISTETV